MINEEEQKVAIKQKVDLFFDTILALMIIGIAWRYLTYIFEVYTDQTFVMAAFVIIGVKAMDLGQHFNTLFKVIHNYVNKEVNQDE